MLNVQVVFIGRRYDAAQAVPERLCLPDGATVDDALKAITAPLSGDHPLSASCLVAVSGMHLGTLADHRSESLKDGDELLLLAPVAGGCRRVPSGCLLPPLLPGSHSGRFVVPNAN